jgi:hypothetical protein
MGKKVHLARTVTVTKLAEAARWVFLRMGATRERGQHRSHQRSQER